MKKGLERNLGSTQTNPLHSLPEETEGGSLGGFPKDTQENTP